VLPQSADYYASDSWSKVMRDVQSCVHVSYGSSTFTFGVSTSLTASVGCGI